MGSMYDYKGKLVLCKCGNKATGGMIGKEAFVSWCKECDPNKSAYESSHKLIYSPPEKYEDVTIKIDINQTTSLLYY